MQLPVQVVEFMGCECVSGTLRLATDTGWWRDWECWVGAED